MAIKDKISNTIKKVKEVIDPKSLAQEDIEISDSDIVLKEKLELRVKEATSLRRGKLSAWRDQLEFFAGSHWKVFLRQNMTRLPRFKSSIEINKIFVAIRSLVAFETDAKPTPFVDARVTVDMKSEEKERLIKVNKKIESSLSHLWDTRMIPNKLTEIYYDRYIFDDGYGMYFWNIVNDDVDFELVKPQEILRSPGSTSIEDAEYIIVEKWRNKKFFNDNYDKDIVNQIKFTDTPEMEDDANENQFLMEASERKNLAKVHYYFEDKIWIVKAGDVILEKKNNPFWEFRTAAEQRTDIEKIGEVPDNWKPIKNHLSRPTKPIIHFKGYHLGGEFYSRSLMKQVMDLNMSLNKRKCQIQDIVDGTSTPQWIVDPSVPEYKARKITSEPGLIIRLNPSMIKKEPASQVPQSSFEDMIHTERSIDDVMGQHAVSRGATPKKRITKGEAEILRESDITPVRLLMRNDEEGIVKLLNGWVQLQKLFYDRPHYIGKLGEVAAEKYGEDLVREEIPENLTVTIKVGSTLPVSREARRAQYVSDFQLGVIDIRSYLEFMDYPNPEKQYQRLIEQQQQGIVAQPPVSPNKGTATPAEARGSQLQNTQRVN